MFGLGAVADVHEVLQASGAFVHLGGHRVVVPFIDAFLVGGHAVSDHQQSCLALSQNTFSLLSFELVEALPNRLESILQ